MSRKNTLIHFGCWSDLNKAPNSNALDAVLSSLKTFINENRPSVDCVIVAGDNYYPFLPPSNKTGEVIKKSFKQKTLVRENLEAAFDGLRDSIGPSIPTYMLIGNHELENSIVNPINSCDVLSEEFNQSAKNDFIMENHSNDLILHRIIGNTCIIMIDTTMYDDITETEPDFECYRKLIMKTLPNVSEAEVTLDYILGLQERRVRALIEKLSKTPNIQNIVFDGHHPLCNSKYKTKDGKEVFKYIRLGNQRIFELLYNTVHMALRDRHMSYYYLCADLHNYEQGIINLSSTDGGIMTIRQIITGTGGGYPDFIGDREKQSNPYNADITGTNLRLNYQIDRAEQVYGFLQFTVTDEEPTFNFIEVNFQMPTGGDFSKKRRKTRKVRGRRVKPLQSRKRYKK
jgi:hypothetical protein